MPPLTPSPSEEYKKRQQARETQVAHFEKLHRRFGNIRLLVVIATLIAAWFSLHREAFSPWWLLLALAIVPRDRRPPRQGAAQARMCRTCRRLLSQRPRPHRRSLDWHRRKPEHASTPTPASTPPTSTSSAKAASSNSSPSPAPAWAKTLSPPGSSSPSPVAEITQRHAAVAELRNHLDLREDIAILGEDLKVGIHPEALTRWAEAPNQLTHPWLRWLSLLLAIAAVAAAIVWAELGHKDTVLHHHHRRNHHHRVPAKAHRSGLPRHRPRPRRPATPLVASRPPRTRTLRTPRVSRPSKRRLSSHHLAASQAIARLRTIVEYIRSLDNPIMTRPQHSSALRRSRSPTQQRPGASAHGAAVRSWLKATGEAEALLSLSGYSYEHPADPFPEFVEGPPCFIAGQLGHPLIPTRKMRPQ